MPTRIVAALLLATSIGCGTDKPAGDSGRASAKLALNWTPEVEHGGFYAALVDGEYKKAGLDVEIVPGGPGAPVLKLVADGAMKYCIGAADDVLLARAQGMPVVAVMAALQTSPRCIMVHEESGIERLADLRDMTLAANPSKPFFRFLQKHASLTGVTVVPYGGNVARFLEDKELGQQGFTFSEPFDARKNGAKPVVLPLAELGFNPYSSVLVTNEDEIAKRPEEVRKFVQASVRGWQRYLDRPVGANEYIHEINEQMALDVLAFGADELKPLALTEESRRLGVGAMTLARWRQLAEQLIDLGLIEPDRVDVEAAFTVEFLPAAPAETKALPTEKSAKSP